jgi:redox-sensitive bicupin YhaK (pirin superfamily)
MSAGTGVTHSEFNHAKDQTTHFLQIWIEPNIMEVPPGYEQKTVSTIEKNGRLCLIASPHGEECAVKIHADAKMYAGLFNEGESATLQIDQNRKGYAHLIKGKLNINGVALSSGDALFIEDESQILVGNGQDAEVLYFDLSPK